MTKANHGSTKEIEKIEPKLILETRSTIEITKEIQNLFSLIIRDSQSRSKKERLEFLNPYFDLKS